MMSTKGHDWLRCSPPPGGKHTHNVKYGWDISIMAGVLANEWILERDWIGWHYLWEELEFDSFSDYAIFNLHLDMGKWHV